MIQLLYAGESADGEIRSRGGITCVKFSVGLNSNFGPETSYPEDITQFFQANCELVPQIRPLSSTSFATHYSVIIPIVDAIELLIASTSKLAHTSSF
jgi:hypothetical protein